MTDENTVEVECADEGCPTPHEGRNASAESGKHTHTRPASLSVRAGDETKTRAIFGQLPKQN